MLLRNFDYISKTELENNSNPPINSWYKFTKDDFKWGDFIAKIVNNRERKRNFVMNLPESH